MQRRGMLAARLATCWLLTVALPGAHDALAQGALTNGGNHTGVLSPGQEHVWSLEVAKDDALDAEFGSIEQQLFGPQPSAGHWSPRRLLRQVTLARRKLRRGAAVSGTSRQLLSELNPAGGSMSPGGIRRLPAR